MVAPCLVSQRPVLKEIVPIRRLKCETPFHFHMLTGFHANFIKVGSPTITCLGWVKLDTAGCRSVLKTCSDAAGQVLVFH